MKIDIDKIKNEMIKNKIGNYANWSTETNILLWAILKELRNLKSEGERQE